jgi:hypothetical protein
MTDRIDHLYSLIESPMDRQFVASARLKLSMLGDSEDVVALARTLRKLQPAKAFDTSLTAEDLIVMRSMKIEPLI